MWAGHLGLQSSFPRTPICAVKSKGFDGAVDMLPRNMDSSYEPTMEARCRTEISDELDWRREVGGLGDCGDEVICRADVSDLL